MRPDVRPATPVVSGAVSPSILEDPYPWYRLLRTQAPVAYSEELDAYLLTRYDDVQRVLNDTSEFHTVVLPSALFPNVFNSDGADHHRYRQAATKHFGSRFMLGLEGQIRHYAERIAGEIVASQEADLVSQFAFRLPLDIVCHVMGVPHEDAQHVITWGRAMMRALGAGLGHDPTNRAETFADLTDLGLYFSALLRKRRLDPRDDLVSALANDGDLELDEYELLLLIGTLLLTGHVTTVNLLSAGLYVGLKMPEVWTATAEAGRWKGYVEEVLRLEPPGQATLRRARRDVEIRDAHIPEGSTIYAYIGSANRDPDHFPNPDLFDPQRPNNRHLSFGGGRHYCLGAVLGRLEARVAYDVMAEVLPLYSIKGGGVEFSPEPGARGLRRLEVERNVRNGQPRRVARLRRIRRGVATSKALSAVLRPDGPTTLAKDMARLRGVLLKVGQLLSFVDVPGTEEYGVAFDLLRDSADPVPVEVLYPSIERELGAVNELFDSIDVAPAAAASIGQVHRARTAAGTEVAIKIQFPDAREVVLADLKNTQIVGRLLSAAMNLFKLPMASIDMAEIALELKERVTEELDYRIEAARQEEFRRIHRGDDTIVIPRVLTDLSSHSVLTSEWGDGIRWSDALEADQELRDRWGRSVYHFVFGSLYRHGLFNADPHPGNYLFNLDGSVTFVDFGCVKQFGPGYVDELKALTLAMLEGRVIDAIDALARMGIIKSIDNQKDMLTKGMIKALTQWLATLYLPLTSHQPFEYSPEFGRHLVRSYLDLSQAEGDGLLLDMPRDLVMLNRINLGVHSVLGALRASADWRTELEDILTAPLRLGDR